MTIRMALQSFNQKTKRRESFFLFFFLKKQTHMPGKAIQTHEKRDSNPTNWENEGK